jgi:hypothetical protein
LLAPLLLDAAEYYPRRALRSVPNSLLAVAQALRIFRQDTWSEGLWQNAASLVVKIS